MNNQIYDSKIIAHNDTTLIVREYSKVYSRKSDSKNEIHYPSPLSDSEKEILDIELRINAIKKKRDEDIRLVENERDNKINELYKLSEGASTKAKRELATKRKITREDAKKIINQIKQKAKEEINALKQNKTLIKNMNKKKYIATTITKKSLKRSATNLKNTVRNNKDVLITFVTLTFADNITDLNEALNSFKKYISKLRSELKKEGKQLYYVCVPEFQKRGAVHYHMLISIEVGTTLIPKREPKRVISEGKPIVMYYYDLPFWDYGYSQALPIEQKNELFDISLYMVKYLTKGYNDKDSERLFGRQKILKSQNLKKPAEEFTTNKDKISQIKNDLECNTQVAKYWHIKESKFDTDYVEHEFTFYSKEERDQYLKEINNIYKD